MIQRGDPAIGHLAEVTSLTSTQASHAQLATIIRGHWGIEDRQHWVRDMDFMRRDGPTQAAASA